MATSLRLKIALAFSAFSIVLLAAQALGVKAFAEAQEEKFVDALIADDMRDLLAAYRADAALVPPLDARLGARLSQAGGLRLTLPASAGQLGEGTHEITLDEREIHVAVARFGADRVMRVYDFSANERRFKRAINALMLGSGAFALLTAWLAFALSGRLVRQVGSLARQVKALRLGGGGKLNPGKYDDAEVVELVQSFNDYHQRMAYMVEREKEFAGNVSHELRTPLTTIKTSCELLEQDPAIAGQSRARLLRIERAADNMIALVNALLLLARDEPDSQSASTSLSAAIADALDVFADAIAAKSLQVTNGVDDAVCVQVNRSVLAIVLSNLVDNAVRHTGEGGIAFSYQDGELCVADTGIGIPSAALPLVFERFYRADPGQGLGMGLAIVKKICDRYHWPVRIESDAGAGTRVYLGLPPAP